MNDLTRDELLKDIEEALQEDGYGTLMWQLLRIVNNEIAPYNEILLCENELLETLRSRKADDNIFKRKQHD